MIRNKIAFWGLGISLVVWADTAVGYPIVSTFETQTEGWTLRGSGRLSFKAAGGNPGGFLRYDDVAGTGGDGWIIAPAKFLGDWSFLDQRGVLSWDHIIINPGGSASILKGTATISGPGGSATFTSPNYFTTQWQTFSVPISQTAWSVTGSWDNLLTNITDLRIRIEACHNGGPGLDVGQC